MTIRGPIPEHIRKRLEPETRRELKLLTSSEAQIKLDTRREKQLQENIANLLRQRGIWFRRNRMDKRTTGPVGEPDFIFLVRGQFVAFEAKTPTGRMSNEQMDAFDAIQKNGGYTYVVRSESEAVEILNRLEVI